MVSQVMGWGNSQGITIEKRFLESLGLRIGDMLEISKKGDEIVLKPTSYNIDWYLQDYERPTLDESWEDIKAEGREIW